MVDPLEEYLKNYSFDSNLIKEIVWGEKYSAVLLKSGQIGVCANLEHKIIESDIYRIDIENRTFRIIYHAFLNAYLNYANKYNENIDIFEAVDFANIDNTVMVGYFRPLYEKFKKKNIAIEIFDKFSTEKEISDINTINKSLNNAGAVILTATSIVNKSFDNIISETNSQTHVFLLGPSCTLDKKMLSYQNIKILFGTIFKLNDLRVLEIISNNGGSREFLKFGKKVQLKYKE